jgi:hypothetical protein
MRATCPAQLNLFVQTTYAKVADLQPWTLWTEFKMSGSKKFRIRMKVEKNLQKIKNCTICLFQDFRFVITEHIEIQSC